MKSCELTGIWSSRWLGEEKHVKITGRIEMYKDKPEIRINAASQLE
jgi:DNA/RNA endonuclease YhcR with UshA esterase domain